LDSDPLETPEKKEQLKALERHKAHYLSRVAAFTSCKKNLSANEVTHMGKPFLRE
jgi:hypothetical protein